MVLEECWNVSKNDLLVLKYYQSFTDFGKKITEYFRAKRFNLNMRNYLVRSDAIFYFIYSNRTVYYRTMNYKKSDLTWLNQKLITQISNIPQ